MEFPSLGEHCGWKHCNRLDFLPVKCSACHRIFCTDHFSYTAHECPERRNQDHQVPECPLCGVPIPVKPGELPDINVGRHIDTDCKSKPALELKGKIFTNACTFERCRKKELVPFVCDRCGGNFCIRHRNEMDHECKGRKVAKQMSKAGQSAIFRAVFKCGRNKNGNNDDVSTSDLEKRRQEEADRRYAEHLSAAYAAERRQATGQSRNNEDNCSLQ